MHENTLKTLPNVSRIVVGKEGKDKTPHLQGVVTFKKTCRFKKVKELLGEEAHIEKCKSWDASAKYCRKEGDLLIDYEPKQNKGDRTDLREAHEILDAGCSEEVFAKRAFSTWCRYPGIYARYKALQRVPTNREISVEVLIGAPGSGKSREAFTRGCDIQMRSCAGNSTGLHSNNRREDTVAQGAVEEGSERGSELQSDVGSEEGRRSEADSVNTVEDGLHTDVKHTGDGVGEDAIDQQNIPFFVHSDGRWWDGYTSQSVIIFDDFYGQIKISYMLRLLDRYPLRLPIKGGFTWARWTHVFITSNEEPENWWAGAQIPDVVRAALDRRIKVIKRFT